MPAPSALDTIIGEGIDPVGGAPFAIPTHSAINARDRASIDAAFSAAPKFPGADEIKVAPVESISESYNEKDSSSDDIIIVTGADAAAHLLPMRDDGGDALTFRSVFLSTGLCAFQAVMYQIYQA